MDRFNLMIPTRDRHDVLVHCLSTVAATDYDNAQFIVSDNSVSGEAREIVNSFRDSRFRYVRPPKRLSMSSNYEYALSYCSHGWVSVLGDDDAVFPDSIRRVVELANFYEVDALSSNHLFFKWGTSKSNDGILLLPRNEENEVFNGKTVLRDLVRGRSVFGPDYTRLPWLYHGGAARLTLINASRCPSTGRFFNGVVPDVYSAVALARITDRYLRIGMPSVISGTSHHSIGTSQMKLSPNLNESTPFAQFLEERDLPFSDRFVLGKSLMTIIFDCLEKSDHLDEIDFHPTIESAVRVMLAYSGKNLLMVLKEAVEASYRCRGCANPYTFGVGVIDWIVFNLVKHIIKRHRYERKKIVIKDCRTIEDLMVFFKGKTLNEAVGGFCL